MKEEKVWHTQGVECRLQAMILVTDLQERREWESPSKHVTEGKREEKRRCGGRGKQLLNDLK
jgi:hypothetical protein